MGTHVGAHLIWSLGKDTFSKSYMQVCSMVTSSLDSGAISKDTIIIKINNIVKIIHDNNNLHRCCVKLVGSISRFSHVSK